MSISRASAITRAFASIPRSHLQASAAVKTAQFSTSQSSLQGYGSGTTYPGQSPSEGKEHPGPEAPDVGQKSPSEGGSAQPKIHNPDHPGEGDESVQQHNAEMDKKKHSQKNPRDEEKVGKGFWQGNSE